MRASPSADIPTSSGLAVGSPAAGEAPAGTESTAASDAGGGASETSAGAQVADATSTASSAAAPVKGDAAHDTSSFSLSFWIMPRW